MLQKLKTAKLALGTLVAAPFAWVAANSAVLAQPAGGGGENANIRGALTTNEEALTALEESTFTQDGVETAAQNTTNALLFVLGAIGIMMTAWGIWKLYKITSEGEQARDSAVTPIIMIVVGGMMTIAAIITGIFPNLFVGVA